MPDVVDIERIAVGPAVQVPGRIEIIVQKAALYSVARAGFGPQSKTMLDSQEHGGLPGKSTPVHAGFGTFGGDDTRAHRRWEGRILGAIGSIGSDPAPTPATALGSAEIASLARDDLSAGPDAQSAGRKNKAARPARTCFAPNMRCNRI